MASLPTNAHHVMKTSLTTNPGKTTSTDSTPTSPESTNVQNAPNNILPSLVFQVTTLNASYQPPVKADTWNSSVPTAKPPSALNKDLASTDEESISPNMKQIRTCKDQRNSGPKKNSYSWLNARGFYSYLYHQLQPTATTIQ